MRPDQIAMLDAWIDGMLSRLETHFARHPYLLGQRPTVGDFGLIGPMYAHFARDPWPRAHLLASRPALSAWVERMATLDHAAVARAFPADGPGDALPTTLLPVLDAVFREFVPMIKATLDEVIRAAPAVQPGRALRRSLGDIAVPMGSGTFRRAALPFTLWKAQGVLDSVAAMGEADRAALRVWLRAVGGEALQDLRLPRLERVALNVRLAGPAAPAATAAKL